MTTPASRRFLGAVLVALGSLFVVAAIPLWFVAIWTHGHDATTRLAGSGVLALIVGVIVGGIGVGIRA